MESMLETTMANVRANLSGKRERTTSEVGAVTLMRALPATEEHLALLEAMWRFDAAEVRDERAD